MKNYKIIIIMLVSILVLCSCKKNEVYQEKFHNILLETPKHVTRELNDKLKIDADIIVPEKFKYEVEVLQIKPKQLKGEEIVNRLYPGVPAINEEKTIYSNQDHLVNVSEGYYYYSDMKERIYDRFFTGQEELLSPTAKDLELVNVEKALEKTKNYLNSSIGLEQIALDRYYVLSKDFLQTKYEEAKQSESWQEDADAGREIVKEDWQEEEGVYAFKFEVIENELPISQKTYFTRDDEVVEGSSITVCCNKDGVISTEVSGYYIVERIVERKNVVGVDNIIQSVDKKFENIIITEPVVVNRIRLSYCVQRMKEKLYLVPAWEVQYEEKNEDTIMQRIIYFEAETGNEIVVY